MVSNPRAVSLPKREADILIIGSQPEEGRLHARKLIDYEVGVYVAPQYLEQNGPVKMVHNAMDRVFIGYIDNLMPTPPHDYLLHLGEGAAPRIKTSDVVTRLAMTVAGAGFSALPCFMAFTFVTASPGSLNLVRLLPDQFCLMRSYWLVMNSDMREISRVRAVAMYVVEAAHAARAVFLPSALVEPAAFVAARRKNSRNTGG